MDKSGKVDFAEFVAWFPAHSAQHLSLDEPVHMKANPGTVDFQVWLQTNGLGDYRRALLAEGYSSWAELARAEPFDVAEAMHAIGALPVRTASTSFGPRVGIVRSSSSSAAAFTDHVASVFQEEQEVLLEHLAGRAGNPEFQQAYLSYPEV